MGKPLSVDVRQQIVSEIDGGASAIEVAEKYHVSRKTVNNLVHHRDRTGSLEPIRGRQGRKSKLLHRKSEILHAIDSNRSMTLCSLKDELQLDISLSALCRTLRRWGVNMKKSERTEEQWIAENSTSSV
jgi:transposase